MKRAVVAVAAVVVYASWNLLTPSRTAQETRSPIRKEAAPPPAGDELPGTGPATTTTTEPAPSPWASIGEDAPSKARYWTELSDPGRSGLPEAVAAETSRLGVALLRADATGEGRTAFYGYWGAGRAQPCCSNVVVHAAGASPTERPDVVQVAVIWSAQRLDGTAVSEQTTVVYFARRGTRWVPLHAWEAAP